MIRWLKSWLATIELMFDKEAMADLRAADLEPDEDAVDYGEFTRPVRRGDG